jgi:hypothetical protein
VADNVNAFEASAEGSARPKAQVRVRAATPGREPKQELESYPTVRPSVKRVIYLL